MKIGIYIQEGLATSGGSFTFEKAILEGLKSYQSQHEIWLLPHLENRAISLDQFKQKKETSDTNKNKKLIYYINKIFKKLNNKLLRFIIKSSNDEDKLKKLSNTLKLDLIWYPNPGTSIIDYETPIFVTVWDLEHRKQPFFPEVSEAGLSWDAREKLFTKKLSRAAVVFTGTEEGKKELIHFYRLDRARVKVNFFPSPDIFKKNQNFDSTKLQRKFKLKNAFILYPAQFWPHKNHVNLLIAIKIINEKSNFNIDLVLTGSDKGNLEYIQEYSKKIEIFNKIHSLGFVTIEELEYLYSQALALVYPSMFGPDNIPPLEAFSLKCPVIMADIPGTKEYFSDAALFFNPIDPIDIANKIEKLLDDQDLRKELIENGLKITAERSPVNYIKKVFSEMDEFEAIRRNWKRGYKQK